MFKGFRQIVSLTFISRIFGLIREVAFAYFFGAGALMDSWFIAFKIPNLARRLFGEGAASASFIPIYSQVLHEKPEQAARLANTVITMIFVVLSAVVLIGWLIIASLGGFVGSETKLVLGLSAVMLPYMVMVCVVALLAGLLNVHKHFAAPAAAPIVLNIFIIGSTIISGTLLGLKPSQQVFMIASAVLLAGVIQLAMQLYPLKKMGITIKPEWDIRSQAFKRIIILMGPMILGLTVTQINTLADDVIAWLLSASPEKGEFMTMFSQQIKYPLTRGSVSHLNFAQRLYQFPLGVLGISLATAIFPVLSACAAKKNYDQLCKTVSKGIKGAVAIAVPASFGLILVARLMISVLFEHGQFHADAAQMTTWTLWFYAVGLCGFFSQQIMTRAFYSLQDSKMPAITAVIAVAVNVVLNLTLIWPLGTGGLALSTAACSYLQVVILAVALRRKFGHSILTGITAVISKTIIASLIMFAAGLAILGAMTNLETNLAMNIVRLVIVVISAAVIYILSAKLLKLNEVLSIFTKNP